MKVIGMLQHPNILMKKALSRGDGQPSNIDATLANRAGGAVRAVKFCRWLPSTEQQSPLVEKTVY